MARQRRNSRRNRRLGRVRTTNIVRRVSNVDIGVEFRPTFDQPSWASAPWWPITLVAESKAAETNYTGSVIHALLLKSLNLSDFKGPEAKPPGFNMRFLTVRIWGMDRQPLTLDIYDNSTSGCRKLKQLNDRGSPVHYSCLGWRFGKSSFAMLNTECMKDDQPVFSIGQPTATTKIAVYLQCLIQRQSVPKVTVTSIEDLLRDSADGIVDTFAML